GRYQQVDHVGWQLCGEEGHVVVTTPSAFDATGVLGERHHGQFVVDLTWKHGFDADDGCPGIDQERHGNEGVANAVISFRRKYHSVTGPVVISLQRPASFQNSAAPAGEFHCGVHTPIRRRISSYTRTRLLVSTLPLYLAESRRALSLNSASSPARHWSRVPTRSGHSLTHLPPENVS